MLCFNEAEAASYFTIDSFHYAATMAISRLPDSTVRQLGATVAVTNSLSLVKELVDNSIDAGATLVEVTISSNTVDRIQIRDNGHGIPHEDHKFLGCRSHTSKLHDFGELEFKCGDTFGFRGEALAGASTLATISVTTRTLKDPIATRLVLHTGTGGVKQRRAVSAPVGTTVVALKLFQTIAVRKQIALKQSQKTLASIKRLLEAYALALPHIRLSLDITGCPPRWTYAPSSTSTTREAIIQIFKGSLAKQCIELAWPAGAESEKTSNQSRHFTLTAILPGPGCDLKEVQGKGSFISVDSRPILASRGTGKKIYELFKQNFTKSCEVFGSATAVPSPFMQLSIKCQPGSYDPNVSASKDELLFTNEREVIDAFQALCDATYKPRGQASTTEQSSYEELGRDVASSAREREVSSSQMPTDKQGALSTPDKDNRNATISSGAILNEQQLKKFFDLDELDDVEDAKHGSGRPQKPASALQLSHQVRPTPQQTVTTGVEPWNGTETSTHDDPVTVEVRTRARVNMARSESNASDDYDSKSKPVQVPPRRLPIPDIAQSKRRPGLLLRTPAKARRSREIDDYFQRTRDEPIVIAEDETATPETERPCPFVYSSPPRRRRDSRYPLVELSEDLMNTRCQEEDENDDYEDDVDALVPTMLDTVATETPRLNIAQVVGIPRFEDVTPRVQETSAPRRQRLTNFISSPLRATTRSQAAQDAPDMSLRLGELIALQTPPSSDPTRGDQSPVHRPFRTPRLSDTMSRGQISPQRSSPLRNDVQGNGVRQARLSWGGIQTEQGSRRQAHQARGRAMSFQPRRNSGVPGHDGPDAYAKSERDNGRARVELQEG